MTLKSVFRPCLALLALAAAVATVACHHIDDKRIPPVAVHVAFNTVGDWNVYGVGGAGSYRYFIRSEQTPQGFPYSSLSYTGFGGILLIGDIHGNPVAYDLACPVECKSTVRVEVDPETLRATCPVCHSSYEVVTNYGYPLSGMAAERGYALQRYYVTPGLAGEYMIITR